MNGICLLYTSHRVVKQLRRAAVSRKPHRRVHGVGVDIALTLSLIHIYGGQFFSVTILLTVDAGVFQMGKLDEPFSALCKVPACNHQLCFAAAVRIVSEERFLRPKAQHFKDMAGDIFADTAVAVTHIPISAGLWRELEPVSYTHLHRLPYNKSLYEGEIDELVARIERTHDNEA